MKELNVLHTGGHEIAKNAVKAHDLWRQGDKAKAIAVLKQMVEGCKTLKWQAEDAIAALNTPEDGQ